MLKIVYKQIYETNEKGKSEWVLVIYDISANHYVGIPICKNNTKNSLYCKSIDKYINIQKISDYNRSKMIRCIYKSGKPIVLSDNDFIQVLNKIKKYLITFLKENTGITIDEINYIKWCRDKYLLNKKQSNEKIIQNAIYWVNFGVGIGSELRKLRPAILWRPSGDKKMWTMIPLTTKRKNDEYYFHYDLECLSEGTAKIENVMNLSVKRVISPYFSKNKLAILTKNDYKHIIKILSKYYLFK